MTPPFLSSNDSIALILGALLFYFARLLSSRKKLPPGPRRLPLIGNAHQFPAETPWISFARWKRDYGDLIYLDLAGKSTLIINSRKVANDLLDKRSSIYSDRPSTVVFFKRFSSRRCGFDSSIITLQQYGDEWKKQRRMVAPDFAQNYVSNYYKLQEKQIALLVCNVLENPANLASEIKFRVGKIILRTTYGHNAQSKEDHFLKSGLLAADNFNTIATPGAFLVDLIPSLKLLPRWMPGSNFLSYADEVKRKLLQTARDPYFWSKEKRDSGLVLQPNLLSNILSKAGDNLTDDDEKQALWASLTMFGAGLDTKISTIWTFLLCMVLNPEVQKKAQAEIDTVIGKDRLPTISDRPDLPYIRSVLAETFRWAPALPLCVPHVLSQDDTYNDYALPKGTMVMPNIWAMFHDPEIYPDPMAFKPERFEGNDVEMEKMSIVFGFGRRICPGRYFAEGTLFSTITTFLATCDILPGCDENGRHIMPEAKYNSGTISIPEEFPIRLKARSPKAVAHLAEAIHTSIE
ncbi:putative monooxygenase [Crepidotus variabilis]|uniref:Monooxygenase n=1 Tax=Crepidotus variabilis TaxID=179855 RepID=A0A9P6E614_9AGAR|nr:putative monooxygenase [Crepidotus variabilis]